jgi:hypothetical protein
VTVTDRHDASTDKGDGGGDGEEKKRREHMSAPGVEFFQITI